MAVKKWYCAGGEPGTFEVYNEVKAKAQKPVAAPRSVSRNNNNSTDTQSMSSGTANKPRKPLNLPAVNWKITVENVDASVDFTKISDLFRNIGKIKGLSEIANNSYVIQLEPNI